MPSQFIGLAEPDFARVEAGSVATKGNRNTRERRGAAKQCASASAAKSSSARRRRSQAQRAGEPPFFAGAKASITFRKRPFDLGILGTGRWRRQCGQGWPWTCNSTRSRRCNLWAGGFPVDSEPRIRCVRPIGRPNLKVQLGIRTVRMASSRSGKVDDQDFQMRAWSRHFDTLNSGFDNLKRSAMARASSNRFI